MSEDEKRNLCECLHDSLIWGGSECLYEHSDDDDAYDENVPAFPFIDDVRKMRKDGIRLENLVLFNNEMIHYEDEEYYKVYKIIDDMGEESLTIFEKEGVLEYTNGLPGNKARYILIMKRAVIAKQDCPIFLNSIIDYVQYEDRDLWSELKMIYNVRERLETQN